MYASRRYAALRSRIAAFAVALIASIGLPACTDGSGPSIAKDREAPTVSGVIFSHDGGTVALPAAATFRGGDTITVRVVASDSARLGWMGIELGGDAAFRDSVAVPDSFPAGIELEIVWQFAPPEWFTGVLRVNGFARDAAGNLTDVPLDASPASVFADYVLPIKTATLDAPIRDLAFDTTRGRIYASQPERRRILVLAANDLSVLAPIPTPAAPFGLDLTVSGDSLVVVLPDSNALGVLDLDAAVAEWSIVPLAFDTVGGRHPKFMRIGADNTALVMVSFNGWGLGGLAMTHDFATQHDAIRADAGINGLVNRDMPLARSRDRSRMLAIWADACCPFNGSVYDVSAGAFIGGYGTVDIGASSTSLDATGTHLLVGASLFDGDLHRIRQFYPPGYGGVSTLSEDGSIAYFRHGSGFLRTELEEGVSVIRAVLPEEPLQLRAVPGAPNRVLAWNDDRMMLVSVSNSVSASRDDRRGAPRVTAMPMRIRRR